MPLSKKICPFKGFWVHKLNSLVPHGIDVRDFTWWQYAINFPRCSYVRRLPSIIWPRQRGTASKRRFWTEVKSSYQQDVYIKLEVWSDFYDTCSSRTSRGKIASLKASSNGFNICFNNYPSIIGSIASSVPEVNLLETLAQRRNTVTGLSATSCSAFEKISSTDVGQKFEQTLRPFRWALRKKERKLSYDELNAESTSFTTVHFFFFWGTCWAVRTDLFELNINLGTWI